MIGPPLPRWVTCLLRRLLEGEQYDEVAGDLAERRLEAGGAGWRATRVTVLVLASLVRHMAFSADGSRRPIRSLWPPLAEVRLALRRWTARPTLALSAIATLSLGLAATTVMFSILDTVVFRALPWPEPERLQNVYVVRPHWQNDPVLSTSWNRGGISWTSFRDIPRRATTLAGFGVWRSERQTLGGPQAELVHVMLASAGVFPMLGVQPHSGRFFTREEDVEMSDSVFVSYETWVSRFAHAPIFSVCRSRSTSGPSGSSACCPHASDSAPSNARSS